MAGTVFCFNNKFEILREKVAGFLSRRESGGWNGERFYAELHMTQKNSYATSQTHSLER